MKTSFLLSSFSCDSLLFFLAMIHKRLPVLIPLVVLAAVALSAAAENTHLQNDQLRIELNSQNGSYTLRQQNGPAQLTAGVAAKVNGQWLHSSDYPKHLVSSSNADGAEQLTITNSGAAGRPDLVCTLSLHSNPAYAEIAVEVRNST